MVSWSVGVQLQYFRHQISYCVGRRVVSYFALFTVLDTRVVFHSLGWCFHWCLLCEGGGGVVAV